MRLGQFARKYDIRVQDIISYLEGTEDEIHSNTKLTDESENDILDFFGIEKEEVSEPIIEEEIKETVPDINNEIDDDAWIEEDTPILDEKITKDKLTKEAVLVKTPEEDIALAEGELEIGVSENEDVSDLENKEEKDQSKPQIELANSENKSRPAEDEVIDTERLMELLESEKEIPDLEKIKLIKAPKKELSGLKVVGKVDLPEPKKKAEEESTVKSEDTAEKPRRNNRRNRPALSEEEKEKRRLRAKRKKEEFEAREAKRKKAKEEKELKEKRASHYKQQLAKSKTAKPKKKAKKQPQETIPSPTPSKVIKKKEASKPTSVVGKVWKWLTNPDQ